MTINRRFFFDECRLRLFGGRFKSTQASGLTLFLDIWEANHADDDDRWLAYILGTVHHEVDRTMLPIRERGGNNYFFRMYDKDGQRPDVARRLGNTEPGDGILFSGRGFVQLTGRTNYKLMANRLNIDLVENPDLALVPQHAAKIIFEGMLNGLFTGKKLSDYFNLNTEDWRNARRIINGTDRADLIGEYAKAYYSAISYTTG